MHISSPLPVVVIIRYKNTIFNEEYLSNPKTQKKEPESPYPGAFHALSPRQ
ncbi:hypothetical protein CE91St57_15310 [Lachnospiraceae bacterium]|nr:hypothetical protein CE91St57_15310 [Lachnospiraceae bacterium]